MLLNKHICHDSGSDAAFKCDYGFKSLLAEYLDKSSMHCGKGEGLVCKYMG